jgi:hypothetical protein
MKRHVCKWVSEWVTRARGYVAHCRYCGRPYPRKLCHRDQLKHELSLAEEGLANYAQENERLRTALQKWDKHCACGCSACEDLYTLARSLPVPQPGEQT